MLEQIGPDIWIAHGADVSVAGFHYPTRMAVIRLSDGGLFIWSPTALTETLKSEVEALGPVRHLVAPNSLHHLFLPEWQRAWPDACSHAAPGLRRKRRDIRFTGRLGDTPNPAWGEDIDQVCVTGNRITTEVVFFHRASGTVLFTDLLQHFPKGWFRGWRAIVARLDRMTGPEPAVPRKFRFAFTSRRAARRAVRYILAWPAQQVLMAHGPLVTNDAQAFLARAFRWLTG
ncbi:DUF4336 domain-containing protein [Pseudoruegeria sp. HB172150]|uniref:DUF4336 domain-containing protein n=1 Tax=Pseudoruegeria sp. HB172150 TaxID=2721164 RepID=UPI0015576AD1|nr:DUF4336 domain-containing protein [Pseudoruegeria sp. HB172150]